MNFRSKNDINYFKFLEVVKNVIDLKDTRHVLEESYRVFKPKNINRFAAALEREGKLKRRFKLDLDFKKAGRFIDADTYRIDNDTVKMFKSLLIPRRSWRRLGRRFKIEDISLREAEHVIKKWDEFLKDVRLRYEYIYNPPVRTQSGESTQGKIERQEFVDYYGAYAEMTYLIGKGIVKDFKTIWDWDLDFFLFWGEYLLRKRDVENIK